MELVDYDFGIYYYSTNNQKDEFNQNIKIRAVFLLTE